jgi:hypothetical protein
MAEYSANAVQIVNPGESVVFTDAPVPCNRGLVRHRDGSGNFLLSGALTKPGRCCCQRSINYLVEFGANISVPEGETVGPISVALVVDGATIPSSEMTVTPAAVDEYFNVSRAINVPIWIGCCESLTVRNTSAIPIQVSNANIIFTR